jgi:hypothetical protein
MKFHAYITRLSDYFRYEAEEPERLGKLPLAVALPLPAAELIRRLKLQGQMLKRWAGSGKEPDPPTLRTSARSARTSGVNVT